MIVGSLKAPEHAPVEDGPRVLKGLAMFPVPLPLGSGQRVDRTRLTRRGEPCLRCGAAGSCVHREAPEPIRVAIRPDARETSQAHSGGGNYRRRRKDGSGVI